MIYVHVFQMHEYKDLNPKPAEWLHGLVQHTFLEVSIVKYAVITVRILSWLVNTCTVCLGSVLVEKANYSQTCK